VAGVSAWLANLSWCQIIVLAWCALSVPVLLVIWGAFIAAADADRRSELDR